MKRLSKGFGAQALVIAIALAGLFTLPPAQAAYLTTDQVLNNVYDSSNKALKFETVTGGASSSISAFFSDEVATPSVQAKASGTAWLYAVHAINTTGDTAYLQIFNKPSASVTLGTTAPSWVLRIPGTSSITIAFPTPISLGGTGLSVAGTTTATGSTEATLSVSLGYK